MRLLYTTPVFFLLLFSCDSNIFTGKLDEGVITYEITYMEDPKENPIIGLLPTSMTVKFKDNNTIQKIEGWMSVFTMAGIAKRKEDLNAAYIKIMGKKMYYETTLDGPSFGFDEMPGIELIETEETKEIAGYTCKKVTVSFPESSGGTFDIYYTNDIKIDQPNLHNPFREIDGVLMEYQMIFLSIHMILESSKVQDTEINDQVFESPRDFNEVPREEMQDCLNSLL